MGDENPIRTLGDYSKPSHKGYRNTIELPVGNNVVPLRSDNIRLVQNKCSFNGLRTAKLRNDIQMFQQHHGESLSEAWTCFKDLLQKVHHHGINRWLQIQICYDHVSFHLKCEIDRAGGGKLCDKNADESWEIIENLSLYDHEGWNDAKEFDYMAAHTERIERFEKAIFKQREEINDKMTEMFGLLKELTTSRAPKKVLIREEAKFSVTKNINSISFSRREEERSDKNYVAIGDNTKKPTKTETETPAKKAEKGNEAESKAENEETTEVPSSQPVEYYLKHRVNEKLIEGLVDDHRFNDSLSGARITRKEDIGGNFEIPCNIGGLKHINALVDQGSNVNVMPLSTYMKLTDERPAETDIRLSLASHSYIYHLGIVEDILVKVAEHMYPVDFIILDIKENENRPFILGTLFLTTAKAVIKFDKGIITLRSGKSRKAYLLEDKQIPSVWVFDEVFSTWMTFGGNTRDLGSFGEETDEITDLHQILEEVLLTERGDGVASIKRRRRDLFIDGVRTWPT
ncbi:MAK10-like protein [Tanacetum coccineum]